MEPELKQRTCRGAVVGRYVDIYMFEMSFHVMLTLKPTETPTYPLVNLVWTIDTMVDFGHHVAMSEGGTAEKDIICGRQKKCCTGLGVVKSNSWWTTPTHYVKVVD